MTVSAVYFTDTSVNISTSRLLNNHGNTNHSRSSKMNKWCSRVTRWSHQVWTSQTKHCVWTCCSNTKRKNAIVDQGLGSQWLWTKCHRNEANDQIPESKKWSPEDVAIEENWNWTSDSWSHRNDEENHYWEHHHKRAASGGCQRFSEDFEKSP